MVTPSGAFCFSNHTLWIGLPRAHIPFVLTFLLTRVILTVVRAISERAIIQSHVMEVI